MTQKWFHAIGVCGKATANVAKMFKDMGWFVTGTDLQFLPPASELIQKAEIPFQEGYHYTHMTREFWEQKLGKKLDIPEVPDLGLVVETASLKNKELLFAKSKNIDIRPFSQILGEYLVKPESIVVIGTAGKTTTTALLVRIFQELGLNPSYMIGADVADIPESLKNTESKWSILEGDEYHSLELSRGAKFLEYKPKYLIISNIGWEHQDIFPTQERYVEEFKKAVELLPVDGLLLARAEDENIDAVVESARCKVIRYEVKSQKSKVKSEELNNENVWPKAQSPEPTARWTVEKLDAGNFRIFNENDELILEGNTHLLGDYNLENILASVALICNLPATLLSDELNFNTGNLVKIAQTIKEFKGPKKRLEVLYRSENLLIVDDFGIAPNRAKNSLTTLKQNFPDYEITAIFEPNSGSRFKDEELFESMYQSAFDAAYRVIIPNLSNFDPALATTEDFMARLQKLNYNVLNIDAENLEKELLNNIIKEDKKQIIVFFSSYRLTQVAQELVKHLAVSQRASNE